MNNAPGGIPATPNNNTGCAPWLWGFVLAALAFGGCMALANGNDDNNPYTSSTAVVADDDPAVNRAAVQSMWSVMSVAEQLEICDAVGLMGLAWAVDKFAEGVGDHSMDDEFRALLLREC